MYFFWLHQILVDWASQGQPKGKAEIPVVTRESAKELIGAFWNQLQEDCANRHFGHLNRIRAGTVF